MDIPITIEKFKEILPSICAAETSADPDHCTPDNPLWGHCANVSLIAQNIFGGELLRASLKDTPFAKASSHYWNRLADGTEIDFTKDQFGGWDPSKLETIIRTRNYVLYDPETKKPREIMKRYKLLAWRLAKAMNPENALFDDAVYRVCFDAALDSTCQKFWVGTVVKDVKYNGGIIYISSNETIAPLKSFCDPKCIRLSIQSRTESMIGACGHSEELAIWEMVRRKIPLSECEFYVAGFSPNFMPYNKKYPEFTCLRCAVQIYNSGVKTVYVSFDGKWVGLTAEECVKQAVAYATKEKTV